MKGSWFIIGVYMAFCCSYSCLAQEVRSRVDSSTFLIGDQTRLIIEGNLSSEPTDIKFLKNSLESVEAIEFITQSSLYKEQQGTEYNYRLDFLIAFFDTGAYYIPSIPVIIDNAGKQDTLYTSTIPVVVLPVSTDSLQMAANKPIIREPWKLIDALPAVAVLVGVALIFAYFYFRRKKRLRHTSFVEEVPKTPFELAMNAFHALQDQHYIEQGRIKEHYAQLSIILRSFLENQFNFPALESTTREIGYGLDRSKFDNTLKASILDNLLKIDLIKFAKVIPDKEEVSMSLELTKNQIIRINKQIQPPITSQSKDEEE